MSQFNDDGLDRGLYDFRARKTEVAAAATLKINDVFEKRVAKIRFWITSSSDPKRSSRRNKVNAYARPTFRGKDPTDLLAVRIVILSELLASLLKEGLIVSEVLMQQFFLAKSVSHSDCSLTALN